MEPECGGTECEDAEMPVESAGGKSVKSVEAPRGIRDRSCKDPLVIPGISELYVSVSGKSPEETGSISREGPVGQLTGFL